MELMKKPIWKALKKHCRQMIDLPIAELFRHNPRRFESFSLQAPHIFVDYSKNRVSQETIELLLKLAKRSQLADRIAEMFQGEKVNGTEHRAVLHTALRDRRDDPLIIDGVNIKSGIKASLLKMRQLVASVHEDRFLGFTGKPITDVVHIGIGGSNLGPKMVCRALSFYAVKKDLRCHFVSNVDGTSISETLSGLNPETTLFCVVSKTFTTTETLVNAGTAKAWVMETFRDEAAVQKHFIAISADVSRVRAFGISEEYIFEFWDWVGGRYSVWSAVGLPIALLVGMDHFEAFLDGAFRMDCHFQDAPFEQNAPVILALIDVWYRNFFKTGSHAVIPYEEYLNYLPAYLQQLMMESNGKSVDMAGNLLNYSTGPVIWGGVGTDGQHAFHQLLHQGTDFIPIDFIVSKKSLHPVGDHHALLFANCLAQSRALLLGKTVDVAYQELIASGYSIEAAQSLAPHKAMPGNRPSNTLVIEKLDPKTLGALIAFYEHRVFVQGIIWGINSFDQFGVDLGKRLAEEIVSDLAEPDGDRRKYDGSTRGLMVFYQGERGEKA